MKTAEQLSQDASSHFQPQGPWALGEVEGEQSIISTNKAGCFARGESFEMSGRFVCYLFGLGFLAVVLFHAGCRSSAGIIGILSSPARHEKVIAAEYDLAAATDRKILVVVDQPGWLGAKENLRLHITDAVNETLVKKLNISPELVIDYNRLSEFRSDSSNFSLLSPGQVGAALGADMVLLIVLQEYRLDKLSDSDYYKGFLGAQAALFDAVAGEEKIWPESAESRTIRVGFEVENRGREAAVKRLSAALAFCTARYFYGCPQDKFRIPEDLTGFGWEDWDR